MLLVSLLALAGPALAALSCGQTPIPPHTQQDNRGEAIVGGVPATPYSWPWQVVWCSKSWFGLMCSLECGGSIIAPGWVMTAGHCVYGQQDSPSAFKVKTGVFKEDSTNESGESVHRVARIHLHPQYKPHPDPQWDIALIQLEDTITYSDHVQPVCLPIVDNSTIIPPNTAIATGWGDTAEDGNISKQLRQVQLPFVDYDTCQTEYPGEINRPVMLCAGTRGEDTCQGDSGGPLVVKSASGAWFQYGITSFGQGCAEYKHPGIYSRVTAYCDWINKTTGGAASCVDPNSS